MCPGSRNSGQICMMDPTDPTSWLYLENGHAFASRDALTRAGKWLGQQGAGLYDMQDVLDLR